MNPGLITYVDTAHKHGMVTQATAPANVPGVGAGSVPISVLLIIVLAGVAWWMFKHGDKTKKLHLAPGFVCLGLGLALSGTQIGGLVGQFFASIASMIATFAGTA